MHIPLRRSVDSSLLEEDASGEHTPLMGGSRRRIHRDQHGSMCTHCCSLTVLYFWMSAINGSLVGALGPSLDSIGRNTGLRDGALGRYVLQNRLCKFAGTLLWCFYSHRLQRRGSTGQPHTLFAMLLLVSAASAFTIGSATTPKALQLGMLCSGVSYGITDSGITSLTVWRWEHEDRRRRFDLALINAGFTVGALLSPMIVAASLRFAAHRAAVSAHHSRWVFEVISGGCVMLAMALFMQAPVTLPPSEDAASAKPNGEYANGAASAIHGLYAEGAHGSKGRRLYAASFIAAMALALGCITGAEHSMATWLPAFGLEVGSLSAQRMAVMASTYWGVMCAGRVAWTALSGLVSSTWPMVFLDIGAALIASVMLVFCTVIGSSSSGVLHIPWLFEPLLWGSTWLLGAGVASGVPCIYSLPPEAQVQMTPIAITILNAASTLGETCFPYLVGLGFERKQHLVLGGAMAMSQLLALALAWGVWRRARVIARIRRRDLEFQID